MTALIRPAKPADRAQLVAHIATLQDAVRRLSPRLRPGRSMAAAYYAQLRRRCVRWKGTILVAESGEQIVGFTAVLAAVPFTELDEPRGTYGLVTDLFVARPFRQYGLGRRLLTQAERHARHCGASELRIGVLARNDPAVRLYRKTGFRPWFQVMQKRTGRLTTA